jgi:hypothetical protein
MAYTDFADLARNGARRGGHSGRRAEAPRSREFRPDIQRGGMAEWSMAVVLKTAVRMMRLVWDSDSPTE